VTLVKEKVTVNKMSSKFFLEFKHRQNIKGYLIVHIFVLWINLTKSESEVKIMESSSPICVSTFYTDLTQCFKLSSFYHRKNMDLLNVKKNTFVQNILQGFHCK